MTRLTSEEKDEFIRVAYDDEVRKDFQAMKKARPQFNYTADDYLDFLKAMAAFYPARKPFRIMQERDGWMRL